jgi:YVTN family beta-propeller protein
VAGRDTQSVAAVDLTRFALDRHIQVGAGQSKIVADPKRKRVYALTPAAGAVHEIDPMKMSVGRRVRVAQTLVSMAMAPGADLLWVSCAEPRQMAGISLERFQVIRRIQLPAEPADFEIAPDGRGCAVTHGLHGTVSFLDLEEGRLIASARAGEDAIGACFRMDGKIALVADRRGRAIGVFETATYRAIAMLKIAVEPEHFSAKPDGGEIFVTGNGMDAVVILNPYHTEVAETVLAGRAPGTMAFSRSPQYLFVTNSPAGDVTVLDPETRRVVAVVSVGAEPIFVMVTPDDGYALILNRRSGTMAVIRPAAIVPRRARGAPLFTTIPIGPSPVHAAVLAL